MPITRRSCLREFLRLLQPQWRLFAVVLVIAVAAQALNLITPWLARGIMDDVIAPSTNTTVAARAQILWHSGLALVALAAVAGGLMFARGYLVGELMWRAISELRERLFWHLQTLSLSFHASQKTGKLVSRLMSDTNQMAAVVNQGGVNLLLDIVFIATVLGIMVRISPLLTVLALLLLPVYAVLFARLNPRLRQASRDMSRQAAVMSGNVQERLSAIALIQSFAAEKHERTQFAEDNEAYRRMALAQRDLNIKLKSVTATVNRLGTAVVLTAGGYLALNGKVTPGDVLAFLMYLSQVYTPLGRLAEINVQLQQALGSMERVFDILHLTPEIANAPDARREIPAGGRVTFDHVDFAYEPGRPVLHDICLDIRPGQRLAVIGPSGSGKSTLAMLVPRLYDVSSGRILFDDVDVRQLKLRSLRRTIGIVQQDAFLFSSTIRENLMYGRQTATEAEIVAAAKAANADAFLQELPDRYDSVVGERGVNLSGGERQRLCLARTILKNPRILILDEATSALDSESENLVQEALDRLLTGRTCIIIAHRLSTIMSADLVVVLQEGRIVERGTHQELWARGGLYAKLLEEQFGPLRDLLEKAQTTTAPVPPPTPGSSHA